MDAIRTQSGISEGEFVHGTEETALHFLCREISRYTCGVHLELAELLITYGADVNLPMKFIENIRILFYFITLF